MYKRSIAAKGAGATQYSNYAVFLTDKESYETALSVLTRAVELDAKDAAVAYNFACFYAKQDKQEEAITWLNRAVMDLGLQDIDWEVKRIKTECRKPSPEHFFISRMGTWIALGSMKILLQRTSTTRY